MKRMLSTVGAVMMFAAMMLFQSGAAYGAEAVSKGNLSPAQAVMMAFASDTSSTVQPENLTPAEAVRQAFSVASSTCDCDGCNCAPGQCPNCLTLDPVDADHTCPKCGAYRNVVNREVNGMHSHYCDHAGTRFAGTGPSEWWHRDPAPVTSRTTRVVQTPRVVIPATDVQFGSQYVAAPPKRFTLDNCPDGKCPVGPQRTYSVAPSAQGGVTYSYESLSYSEAPAKAGIFSGDGGPVRKILGIPFRIVQKFRENRQSRKSGGGGFGFGGGCSSGGN